MFNDQRLKSFARLVRNDIAPLHGIMNYIDYKNVCRMPRYTTGSTRIEGNNVLYSDSDGFIHSVGEIFRDKVYQFNAKTPRPHIIDAGANIGLSILYFKKMYPDSTIVAYEPDADIFNILKRNVGEITGVELYQAAAWTENTNLTFYREKSLAGSVSTDFMTLGDKVIVPAHRLRDEILKRPVDFLKIDIEGAENSVLFDIADTLDNVDHLFFEYHSVQREEQRLGDMLRVVTEHGFRYTINGTHGPDLPFVQEASLGFDLQCNIFCIRK